MSAAPCTTTPVPAQSVYINDVLYSHKTFRVVNFPGVNRHRVGQCSNRQHAGIALLHWPMFGGLKDKWHPKTNDIQICDIVRGKEKAKAHILYVHKKPAHRAAQADLFLYVLSSENAYGWTRPWIRDHFTLRDSSVALAYQRHAMLNRLHSPIVNTQTQTHTHSYTYRYTHLQVVFPLIQSQPCMTPSCSFAVITSRY